MRFVNIEFFNIARTAVDRAAVRKWLNHIGANEYEIPSVDVASDPALLIALAAKRCFDDQTDILTDSGWKRFSCLDPRDKVATLNKETESLEFQETLAIWQYSFNGNMKCVESRDVSFCVTPDHRQWTSVRRQHDGVTGYDPFCFWTTESLGSREFKVKTAATGWIGVIPDEIIIQDVEYTQQVANQSGVYGNQPRTTPGFVVKGKTQILALAKLMVYYATEGTHNNHSGLYIYGDHEDGVRDCADALGLPVSVTIDQRSNVKKIRVGGGLPLGLYASQNCGEGSPNKRLPRWILDLPKVELSEIWELLVETDGTSTSGRRSLLSTSTFLVDAAQEILCKLGKSSSVTHGRGTNYPVFQVHEKVGRDAVLNGAGATKMYDAPYDGVVYCVSTRNGVVLVRRHGKVYFSGNCYMSFEPGLNPNVTKVRKDTVEYLDNVLAQRHGSVLEHAVYSYAIEGVSRVFTGELNRHRAGVGISEGSMRYIRYTDIPMWLPTSITYNPDDPPELADKKERTRKVFERHLINTEIDYKDIQDIWAEELAPTSKFTHKKHITSMARRIIPMGVATGGVWTMNLRAVRHILALRTSPAAEEEIAHVFVRIGEDMMKRETALLGDFENENGSLVPKYEKV